MSGRRYKELLPDDKLPAVDVVNVGAAIAYAAGACANGRASLAGASQVSGIRALGQELPVNAVVDQAFTLVESASIDLANLDLSKVALPSFVGVAQSVLRPIVEASLVPVLATLLDIAVPAALAQVKITPGEQVRSAGRLTQRALRVQVSVAGQSLTDLVLGEASVSESGVDCSTGEPAAAEADAADLALACTTRRLVLTDVIASGRRVKLLGAADKALAGATVSIRLLATGRTVATARIGADGAFSAGAPLPPRSIRSGNRARYQAIVGSERSLDLKLARRMIVTSMRAAGGRVTITGRVTGPLARPIAPIFVERRLSCDDTERVGEVTPRRDGSFRVTVAAPEGAAAAVYRLTSTVRKKVSSPKTFPTYTLPRAVSLH